MGDIKQKKVGLPKPSFGKVEMGQMCIVCGHDSAYSRDFDEEIGGLICYRCRKRNRYTKMAILSALREYDREKNGD